MELRFPNRYSRVGLAAGCAGLVTAGMLAWVVGANAQGAATTPTGPGPSGQSEQPGAVGVISGQTPSQSEAALDAPIVASVAGNGRGPWWSPGEGTPLGAYVEYANQMGRVGVVNSKGALQTKGHPFFEPIGGNGRACVSCHQPTDAMSLSLDSITDRWAVTGGKDPIFAPVDGSNCPSAPQDQAASHSALLKNGLFRIFLPWPPKTADGSTMNPEFDLEVVSDPLGCNTDPTYGLKNASNPTVSVYRRPRVVANMRYYAGPGGPLSIKDASVNARDPETGQFSGMNIMADAREPTQRSQAVNAHLTHLQGSARLSETQLKAITDFEDQIYVAQSFHTKVGALATAGAPEALGPRAVEKGTPGLGDNFYTPVFGWFKSWEKPAGNNEAAEFKASAARGMEIFLTRTFYIRDVTHLNTVGLGNPIKRTCATCHNARMTGMDVAPGYMDLGTGNRPWATNLAVSQELPVFKLTCKNPRKAHPFLGPVVYTNDPGRALISGRCIDMGAITMQQFRGLAARAPYFSNGGAKDLKELIDFYDKRFEAKYTEQEKTDLVNFLSVL